MAELILTQEEQDAKLWTDLDDASLGKVLKRQMYRIKTASEQYDKMITMAASFILIDAAIQVNADKLKIDLENFGTDDNKQGDWKVTVLKILKK